MRAQSRAWQYRRRVGDASTDPLGLMANALAGALSSSAL